MQGEGTVLWAEERPVYHADSGLVLTSLMAVTSFPPPLPPFVLTREISMPNADDATVSYTEIPGTTLEECLENMDKASLMILNPTNLKRKNGPPKNSDS